MLEQWALSDWNFNLWSDFTSWLWHLMLWHVFIMRCINTVDCLVIETKITVRYAARLRNQHHCSCLQSIIYPRLVGTLYMNRFVFQRSILESTLSFFSSRRSDPRGIIEYRDLDAPDDGDIFWGCGVGGGYLIVGAYIIKDSFARLVDSNVVSCLIVM